ncbi:MAG TPA: hypothetical protein VMT73_11625 [Anaerolineales bacterium]|nr:hypothetical protein [Anaerolineales bacterium]
MKLTGKHYAIIFLGLFTAILHLLAALDRTLFPDGPDPLFLLNGLGYIGLLGAYFLPMPFFQERHKLVWQVLFGYTILTIVAWLVIWVGFSVIRDGMPFFSHDSLYGVPAKIAEVLLLTQLQADKPA